MRKGSKVYTEGELSTRKWQDQSGNDRYTTEIVLRRFRGELVALDPVKTAAISPHNEAKANGYQPDPAQQQPLDDEIPF